MDLFDDDELEGKKVEAPAKTRFAPKSKLKKPPAKAPPKVEPPQPPEDEAKPVVVVKQEVAVEKMEVDTGFKNGGGVSGRADDGIVVMAEDDEKEVVSTSAAATAKANSGEVVMKEEEEEDQVVAEYDVYFTPRDPDTQLYVMQYPLRPSWRPYELEQRCTEVRVRPNSSEVELDLSVDVHSDNFDPESAVAQKMQKQTLSSSGRLPQASGYAAGLLMGRKLYLNPIHGVVQLRPSMEYLDSVSSRLKTPNVAAKEEIASGGAVAGPSRKQNKQMDPEVVESWIPLRYHSSTSDLAQRYLRKMVTEEGLPLQFSMNPYDYLNSLCPAAVINKVNSGGPSRRSLLSLPLNERLKTWLVEGPPVQRFSAIKHLAPDGPIEDVLQILQELALLVQGLWVAKTDFRHPELKPGSAGYFAREYALLLFHCNPVIKDSELSILGSQKNNCKRYIREFAVERSSCKDWKFKEPTDVSFIKLHPDVVEHQKKVWLDKEMKLEEIIQKRNETQKLRKPGPSVRPEGNAGKPTTGARSVDSAVPREAREALSKVLEKLFQTHKVCNFQTICQGLRDTAVSMSTNPKTGARATAAAVVAAVKSVVDAPQENLQSIISEFAVNVHGVYLLKPSTENPELNPFRNVVIDLFSQREPGIKLKKGEIMDAAETKPTATEFQKVMNEYCVSQGGAWVLKTGDVVTQNDWQGFFKAAKLL